MTWPLGTINGGRPYAELGPLQFFNTAGQPPFNVPGSPGEVLLTFPWAAQGFNMGVLELQITQLVGVGLIQIFVSGFNSDGSATLVPLDEMALTNALVTPLGTNIFQVTFGDGPLPGNTFQKAPGGPGTTSSNRLNPTMMDSQSSLQLRILNSSANAFTFVNARVKLRG